MIPKRDAIIVDVDGTLANNDHRRALVECDVDKRDWPSFFYSQFLDTPKKMVGWLVGEFAKNGYVILVVTGRDRQYWNETSQWIMEHFDWWPKAQMFMREGPGMDYVVKQEIYEKYIAPRYNVHLVIDDRSSVVKMWRSLGLECWQVAEGDF